MPAEESGAVGAKAARHLASFQELLALPRETVPQSTAEAARRALRAAAAALRLELVEINGLAPTFLMLPPAGREPEVTLFGSWHAESLPVTPAAVEGAERLALAACAAALGEGGGGALVVAPAASHGSLPLGEALAAHRERLRARVAFWPRIGPVAPDRRRIFLGARGRVVLGLRGGRPDARALRDPLVRALAEEAYGPRPLDFELIRKLAGNVEAMEFLEDAIGDPAPDPGAVAGDARLREALFAPRGQVLAPAVHHPDRPSRWLVIETAEAMEADDIRRRTESLAADVVVEVAEATPWDRIGIHHPAVRAAIAESKLRSAGPEIWPMAPWTTPSGVFTRSLGTPLLEWAIPLPAGALIRFPTPEAFGAITRELASLLRQVSEPRKADS